MPMMFILALKPLQRLFEKATKCGFLSPIMQHATKKRADIYANDVAIFLNPVKEELNMVFVLLAFFDGVLGLTFNQNKCIACPRLVAMGLMWVTSSRILLVRLGS